MLIVYCIDYKTLNLPFVLFVLENLKENEYTNQSHSNSLIPICYASWYK